MDSAGLLSGIDLVTIETVNLICYNCMMKYGEICG